ncbi:MAG: FtsQ-type POTRA domain-containing protein, partial [Candidatus Subteraquimicrobiales bacterium]|nr:FtsQ-type POTRA domain-containing protein [Candidatus Subteraquimicrobiales bacterium]
MKTRRDRYCAISRRRKRIKWLKRLRLLALFVLIYLVASGFISVYNSSYFNVKKINVVGNCQLSDTSVKKLSEVAISKDSLLKLSTTEIKERLLKNPWVEDAQVIRDFPSTLKIKVREREPVVYISFKGKL